MVLYAIARPLEIGIDIERIRTDFECVEVAERFFSHCESHALRTVLSDVAAGCFFNYWTGKEAMVMALGEGRSCPLNWFDVHLTPNEPARLASIGADSSAAAQFCLQEMDDGDG